MKLTKTMALAALLMAGGATVLGTTFAEARGQRGAGANFEQMDTNNDGFVTAAEIEAAQNARFASTDANGDGFLTKEELKASITQKASEKGREIDSARLDKRLDRMMEKADADKDGKIAQSEMKKRDASQIIERLDTDKDGRISKAEMEAAKGKRKNRDG